MNIPYKIKPTFFAYMILIIITTTFVVLAALILFQKKFISASYLSVGIGIISYFIYARLFRISVVVKENTIEVYRYFSTSYTEISKLGEVKIEKMVGDKPEIKLLLFHCTEFQKNPIKINPKLFSKKDLVEFANYLIEKNPDAIYDSEFIQMSKGKMPTIYL